MSARRRPFRRAGLRLAVATGTALLIMAAFGGVGHADPSPTPDSTPTATADESPSATTSSPSATPTTPTHLPTGRQVPQAEQAAAALSLTVTPTGGVAGKFWSDIGSYAFRGSASGLPDGAPIEVHRRSGTGGWSQFASAEVDSGGGYAVDVPVLGHGTFTFVATSGGDPNDGDGVTSAEVTVTVGDAKVVFNRPATEIDALQNPRLTGSIVPARAGVTVNIDVLSSGTFRKIDDTTTDANGRFALYLSHGRGNLAGYRIRAAYRVPNRSHWETSGSHHVERIAVLNGVVTPTTAEEVSTTYHSGCPVGRSRLSTITMNYYGLDSKMHRGVMIVRSDLTGELKYAFSRSLSIRFPITSMKNPNAYGGNDPKQMAADNSSGFNCRPVVGNPYRTSPHSYGIAVDVNPRQNPYRDVNGKWWPSNGTAYIDRTPRRQGMLSLKSTMVKVLRNDGFFWGGLWYPGRDYQHFQY